MPRVAFAVRIALGALALLLFQTIFWIPGVPLAMRVAFGAFAVMCWLSPYHSLLVVAALAPLSLIVSGLVGLGTVRAAEAIVLAFLAGCLLQRRRVSGFGDVPGVLPGALLIVTIIASCAVSLAVERYYWAGPPSFLEASVQYLARGYLGRPDEFRVIPVAFLLIEGVGLLAAIPPLCAGDPRWTRRLLRMSVIGGMGGAAASMLRIAFAFMNSAEPLDLLSRLSAGNIRLSLLVPDVNAAGSYFVLVALLALGGAASSSRSLPFWLVAFAFSGMGLLLTGSRSAVTAGLLVLLTGSWLLFSWRDGRRRRRIAMSGVTVAVTLAVLFTSLFPEVMFGRRARRALDMRGAFITTSLRMLASAPVFGVGIGNYYSYSSRYMPPWLLRVYPRENAHNYFLQVAAELGMVGGVLFILVIARPLRRSARAIVASRGDPELAGIVAGLAAFLTTCLSGHPLLQPPVAYAFWTCLGLAVARSDALSATDGPAEPYRDESAQRWAPWAVLAALAIVVSVPVRAGSATSTLSLARVTAGFSSWQRPRRGPRFRWTGARAMFYVPATTRAILLPIGGPPRGVSAGRVEVRLSLDGMIVNRVSIEEDEWVTVRMLVPESEGTRFRRIELEVFPTWTPERTGPESTRRVSGVRVGDVQLLDGDE